MNISILCMSSVFYDYELKFTVCAAIFSSDKAEFYSGGNECFNCFAFFNFL